MNIVDSVRKIVQEEGRTARNLVKYSVPLETQQERTGDLFTEVIFRGLLVSSSHGNFIQVRSECLTCTFRASCCSVPLSWGQVPAFAGSSIRDRRKKKGGGSKGELPALAGTREYEQSDRNQ